jgi:hypothetical protein
MNPALIKAKKSKITGINKPQPIATNQMKVISPPEVSAELLELLEKKKVVEEQRILQQNFRKPIISTDFKGRRIVLIGSKVFDAGNCKTFHEVLSVYLSVLLGEEWIKKEIEKKLITRHPILQWHNAMIVYQRENIQGSGKIQTASNIGAIPALLGLAYNLYLIAHNSELQEKLITRLRDFNQFLGAHYEVQVAAFCIQAGFEITLEDEDDPNSTHCEFTVTNIKSGRKFSVEAKARTHGKNSGAISSQLYSALKKSAEYERIIFININSPEKTTDFAPAKWIHEATDSIRGAETRLKIKGNDAPPAYVLLTNQQNTCDLNNIGPDTEAVAESFKIADFRVDYPFASLKEAIDSRGRHKEVKNIFEAIKRHHEIPSTFDGEVTENLPKL